MAASAVKICSRKKGKAKGPSELEKLLLGYYIRLGPGSKGSRMYLEIKWLRRGKQINRNLGIKLFYPKIRGHVFTPKFGEKNMGTQSYQNCVDQGLDCMKIDIS